LNFAQFVNRTVKIPGRGLYSPRLRDVAWLEDAQFIFLIFHPFVCNFGWVDAVRGEKNTYIQMYGKLEKLTERLLTKLIHASFKLGEYNPPPSILYLGKMNDRKSVEEFKTY